MAERKRVIVSDLSFEGEAPADDKRFQELMEELNGLVHQWNKVLFPRLIGAGNPFPNVRLVAHGELVETESAQSARRQLPDVMDDALREAVFGSDSEEDSCSDTEDFEVLERKRKSGEELEEQPASKVPRHENSEGEDKDA